MLNYQRVRLLERNHLFSHLYSMNVNFNQAKLVDDHSIHFDEYVSSLVNHRTK